MMGQFLYLLKKDVEDLRDYLFDHTEHISASAIPASADLTPKMPPVFDQGQLGSCTANASLGMRQYYMLTKNNDQTQLSRLYFYYKEREMEGTISEDCGAQLRDAMRVITSVGCAPETDFPYVIANFAQKPSMQAETDASKYKLSTYHRVPDLNGLKGAIAAGIPVVMGIVVYSSFESQAVAHNGMVPIPVSGEKALGGHAVLAVGFDDAKQLVKVRNSWGTGWGDKGYFYLPYSMFGNTKYVTDMWVAQ